MATSNSATLTNPRARRVSSLTDNERTKIFNNLGPEVEPFVIAVVEVFKGHPRKNKWKLFLSGVLCFVYDTILKAYFFRLYTLKPPGTSMSFLRSPKFKRKREVKLVWDCKIKTGLMYYKISENFGEVRHDSDSWGFLFQDEEEATVFGDMVIEKLSRRKELENTGDSPTSRKILSPVTTNLSEKSNVEEMNLKPHQQTLQGAFYDTTIAWNTSTPSKKAELETSLVTSKQSNGTLVNCSEEQTKELAQTSYSTKLNIWFLSSDYKEWYHRCSAIAYLVENQDSVFLYVRDLKAMERIFLRCDLTALGHKYKVLRDDFVALKFEKTYYGFEFNSSEESDAFVTMLKERLATIVSKKSLGNSPVEETTSSPSPPTGFKSQEKLECSLVVNPPQIDLDSPKIGLSENSPDETYLPLPEIGLERSQELENPPTEVICLLPPVIGLESSKPLLANSPTVVISPPEIAQESVKDLATTPSDDSPSIHPFVPVPTIGVESPKDTENSPTDVSYLCPRPTGLELVFLTPPPPPPPPMIGLQNLSKSLPTPAKSIEFFDGSPLIWDVEDMEKSTDSLLHRIVERRKQLKKVPVVSTPKNSPLLIEVLQRRMQAHHMSTESEDSRDSSSCNWSD